LIIYIIYRDSVCVRKIVHNRAEAVTQRGLRVKIFQKIHKKGHVAGI